ncbi:F-box protein [Rosa sericea]
MADDQNCCTKKRAQQCESKWSELPIEIAELILEKLASIDILRFKAPLPQSPWLVLGNGQEDNSCRFFSLEEKKVYTIKNILFEGCCVGSSRGWLVIMNKDSILNLFNPVSGESIQLSDIRALDGFSGFSSSEILKAVLSSEPSGRNKFFLTICIRQTSRLRRFDKLAVYNHEDKTWSSLLVNPSSREIVFHNGKLFALLPNVVQVWDFEKSRHDRTTVYIFKRDRSLTRTYLVKYSRFVESLGEILRVTLVLVKSLDDSSHKEPYFEVYKMNLRPTRSRATWEKVESLGHIFIIWCLNRSSIALSASYFTEFEENSIYCYDRRRRCIFVYNLKDKVVKPCHKFDESTTDQEPFWIVPNLSLK